MISTSGCLKILYNLTAEKAEILSVGHEVLRQEIVFLLPTVSLEVEM